MKLIALSLALCLPIAAGDEDASNFKVNVNLVQVRVAVTDGAGNYVRNLQKGDFRIRENGVEQKIRTILTPAQREPAASTSVFVLFDTSNRMYDGFVYAEDAIADFIRRLPAADPVAVYGFSRNVTRLVGPTRDRFADMVGLRHAVSGDETALYDAMLITLRDAATVSGNRVIVLFSNGPDNASMLTPPNVRWVAEDEGIPVYVISTRTNTRSTGALLDIASHTGGVTYFAGTWQEEKAAFDAIGDDLGNSYVLGYYSEGAVGDGYRKIDVEVAGHKYHVRARTGYHPAH